VHVGSRQHYPQGATADDDPAARIVSLLRMRAGLRLAQTRALAWANPRSAGDPHLTIRHGRSARRRTTPLAPDRPIGSGRRGPSAGPRARCHADPTTERDSSRKGLWCN